MFILCNYGELLNLPLHNNHSIKEIAVVEVNIQQLHKMIKRYWNAI